MQDGLAQQTGVRSQAPDLRPGSPLPTVEQGRVTGTCEARSPSGDACSGHRQTVLKVLQNQDSSNGLELGAEDETMLLRKGVGSRWRTRLESDTGPQVHCATPALGDPCQPCYFQRSGPSHKETQLLFQLQVVTATATLRQGPPCLQHCFAEPTWQLCEETVALPQLTDEETETQTSDEGHAAAGSESQGL